MHFGEELVRSSGFPAGLHPKSIIDDGAHTEERTNKAKANRKGSKRVDGNPMFYLDISMF